MRNSAEGMAAPPPLSGVDSAMALLDPIKELLWFCDSLLLVYSSHSGSHIHAKEIDMTTDMFYAVML